jgi:branched-chain amino acid transport system substrate-binding protein
MEHISLPADEVYRAEPNGRKTMLLRTRKAFGLRVAIGLGALVLVAAACSSSKSTNSSSTNNSQGSTAGSSSGLKGAPIKIGYIEDAVSLGSGTSEPYTIPALNAWVQWTNAHGGMNGHPVQLLSMRETNNPGLALTDVQKLVGSGIVGLVSDDTEDENAWASYIEKAGVPVFEGTSGSATLAENPIEFSTNTSILFTPEAEVAAAAKVGGNKVAVLYCAEIPECAESVPAYAGAGKAVGVKVAMSTSILGSSPNYIAQCLTAKQHGANSMIVADASTIILRVAASCAQQGYTPHQVASGENIQQNMAGAPGMDGLIAYDGYAPFFDTSFPGVQTMLAAFNQYDPSLPKLPEFGDLSTQQWTTGLLIGEAAKAGGVGSTNPITPAALLNGLYTLHSTNLDGMVPTMTFVRGQANVNKCWYWVEIQNNKYTLPDGLTPSCFA